MKQTKDKKEKTIVTEIKSFYINRFGMLYCQHNASRMKNIPSDIYEIGDKIKMVCHHFVVSGTVIQFSKAGVYLKNWNIGED